MADKYARAYCAIRDGDCDALCQLWSSADQSCCLFSINNRLKAISSEFPKAMMGMAGAIAKLEESVKTIQTERSAIDQNNLNYKTGDKAVIEQYLAGKQAIQFVNLRCRTAYDRFKKWLNENDIGITPNQRMFTNAVLRKFDRELGYDKANGGGYIPIASLELRGDAE